MISDIFTTSLSGNEITPDIAAKFIRRHLLNDVPRLETLYNYYLGEQNILNRHKDKNLSNNRLVINHAAYIANFTAGYLLGTPVSYSLLDEDNEKIQPILDALKTADAPTQDADLALDGAIFGRSYDLVYVAENDTKLKLARLSPLNAFVVYDDTVEQKPVFGIHYYPIYDVSGLQTGYKGIIATDTYIQDITLSVGAGDVTTAGTPIQHFFGKVPIDEIYNNGQRLGDFENVISLIDAYNLLQSDRLNDKEQFVNALLVIKGQILGDTDEQKREALDGMKENQVMELAADGEAAFLTRQFDESSVEVYKNSIVNDIHKISCVPDMSDQNFAGNVSGVAMKYKLLALEQLAKVKQRFFTEGLRYRLECISNFLRFKTTTSINVGEIDISFRRSLPANEIEQAQMVSMLNGIVPQEYLLSQIDFVSDPKKAMELIEEEKQAAEERAMQTQRALMNMEYNTPISKSEV